MAALATRDAAEDMVDWASADIPSSHMPAALTTDHYQPSPADTRRTVRPDLWTRERMLVALEGCVDSAGD